jgi:hypothetical protein
MTNSGYNAHTNPIFKQDPKVILIQEGQLLFLHAFENNYAPKSLPTYRRKKKTMT